MRRCAFSMMIAALLLGVLPAMTQSEVGKRAEPGNADNADVRGTLQRLYAAWSDLDPAKAAPFYAKEPDLIFFDISPMKYTGWSEYAAGVPKAFAPYQSGKFVLNNDLQVHRQGNLAWAVATWRADLLKKAGGTDHMEGRYTAILEKRGNKWLVIHEHMSVPPNQR